MAKYDQGGGCACGLNKTCDCNGKINIPDNQPPVTLASKYSLTPQYKYSEDIILKDIKEYIDKTYSAHYAVDGNMQAVDAWIAMGDPISTFRNTAVKYLWRLGRKGEEEDQLKDLLKAIHYCIFAIYFLKKKKYE